MVCRTKFSLLYFVAKNLSLFKGNLNAEWMVEVYRADLLRSVDKWKRFQMIMISEWRMVKTATGVQMKNALVNTKLKLQEKKIYSLQELIRGVKSNQYANLTYQKNTMKNLMPWRCQVIIRISMQIQIFKNIIRQVESR